MPFLARLLIVLTLFQIAILGVLNNSVDDAVTITQLKYLSYSEPLQLGQKIPDFAAYNSVGNPLNIKKMKYPVCIAITSCPCQLTRAISSMSNLKSTHEQGILLTPVTPSKIKEFKIIDPNRITAYGIRYAEVYGLSKGHQLPTIVHVDKDGYIVSITDKI